MLHPLNVSHLARIRQQEILEWAANEQAGGALEEVFARVSGRFVQLGWTLVKAVRSIHLPPSTALTVPAERQR
ncbi:MAG TPA: hypothetical protein VMT34_13665 [Aggregatilineales bacterium]|nr:hypothetical protein [Aggregatilineales bacterium]